MDEFETAQKLTLNNASVAIKEQWTGSVKDAFFDCFGKVGKGWYNIKETDRAAYDFGKMKKYQNMIRMRMEDTLRFLVDDAVASFTAFIHATCSAELSVNATNDVEPGPAPPLFAIELQNIVSEDAANPKLGFEYSTPLDDIKKTVIETFENAVTSVYGIPFIEPDVITEIT